MQHVGVRCKLQDLHDECRKKIRKALSDVDEAVELAQELLRSTNVPVDSASSWEVSANARGDVAEVPTVLEMDKARIEELGSVETMTVRRHKVLIENVKQLNIEKVSV